MTVEEIRQAKAGVEARIRAELIELSKKTGMDVAALDVRYLHTMEMGSFERRHVTDVHIELRVP